MAQKTFRLFLFIGIPLAVCCWILLLFAAAGYQYEHGKLMSMVFTTVVVFIFQFIVGDPIKFVLQALWQTFFQKDPKANAFRHGIPRAKKEEDDIRFFKMRIEWGKSRLRYNWRHRDEALNLFYKNVAHDLFHYGRFYISLIILIIILNEPLSFYHSDGLRKVFSVGRSSGREIENLEGIDQLYDFLKINFVDALDPELNEVSSTQELNWVSDEVSKLLGVVRLIQVRLKHKMLGLDTFSYTHEKFLPGWKPYIDYPYKNKYWRIYDPWVPTKVQEESYHRNEGFIDFYPTDSNYVAFLTRNLNNSKKVLEFLKKENWLDEYTAMLFMDFIVYNVDTNIYSLCKIMAETTPFGNIIIYIRFESIDMMPNWSSTSQWCWIVLLVYVFQLISFVRNLILKLWYGSLFSLVSIWNILDWFIVIANIVVFCLLFLRIGAVLHLMKQFKTDSKEKFISFQSAKNIEYYFDIFLALLVFCASIRLWKVLLFARVFRLYVRTLMLGAADIFWALLNIMIFLIGLTISSYIINGTSRTRSHAPISSVHILSFSLGYSERVNPLEHSQIRTSTMGLIIYALMMFGVTLVLLNMLITLICIHYAKAKQEDRERPQPKITFWQFLKVEYSYIFNFFQNIHKKTKRKLKGQFFEKMQRRLGNVENKLGVTSKKKREYTAVEKAERQASALRRIRIMTGILLTQTEILNRRLNELNIKLDSNNL